MRGWVVLALFIMVVQVKLTAQSVNLSDSLRHVFSNTPRLSLKLDFRNSFITGRSAQIGGVRAGAAFGKTMNIGLGYSWLYSDLTEDYSDRGIRRQGRVVFRYLGPYIEYSFYRKGPWESMVTANLSYGKVFLDPDGRRGRQRVYETGVFVYEPTMAFEYKILNLVGVGAGYGYRLAVRGNRDEIKQNFTAPVYVLRFRLILDRFEPHWRKMTGREP